MKVYTGGTFDVPHAGHIAFLQKIKKLFPTAEIIIALNTDEFIERFKGKKPIFSYEERERLLEQLGYRVIRNFGDEDSKKAILWIHPDILAIGNDWLDKDYLSQMDITSQWLREQNIALCYIPYTDGISTSEIKRRLNEN